MDKRYQIFISSTFVDLLDERQSVLKAILELDHMPAGMELFPASDDTAWELIKDVIDASDYYVLIVGGRYGSLDEEGLGYTEKEYRYALSTKKPVIPLLHANPDNLPREKTETNSTAWDKLQDFRTFIENNHTCVYWKNADELKAKVIVGLTSTIKRSPTVGWVRADNVPSDTSLKNIIELRNRVTELEEELKQIRTSAPSGTEDLMQGDDPFEIKLTFFARHSSDNSWQSGKGYTATISPSWDDIFSAISPVLINEATEADLHNSIKSTLSNISKEQFSEYDQFKEHVLHNFNFTDDDIYTIVVQLRALGLIKESDKKRSVRDTATYWKLTPYGDQLMVQLRALSRTVKEQRRIGGDATQTGESDENG